MRAAGLLLLVSGWAIVLAAIALLPAGGSRAAFLTAGFCVEALGLGLALNTRTEFERERP
jgi:hypothetical protein